MTGHPASFAPVFISLSEQIAVHAKFRAQEIALIEGQRRVDWASYSATGDRIGWSLVAAGVKRGDRVAMVASNHIWAHELLLGIWRAGAAVVPLSPMLDVGAMGKMIADSGAVMIFSSTEYQTAARAAAGHGVPVIGEGEEFDGWLADAVDVPRGIAPAAEDLAIIIYSSGTTGVPKGIVHNHASRLAFAANFAAEFRFHYRSVALSAIPMHSNGAWLSWSPAMWMGATTLVLPVFTPDAFIQLVKAHKPTHGFIVPAMAKALLAHPDVEQAGLTCFETAITAGSPMMVQTKREIVRLTGGALYELWGLTEGVATIISPQDMEAKPHSVGRPMLGCDIRLVDTEGQDVTFKGPGEIVGFSAGMMSGYWNRPDANEAVVWKDETGKTYIRTGDVGEFDHEGYLTLRGRIKDMILSGGFNVYPVDIEARLLEHEAVVDAAVIGIANEKWGETPVAFVILKPAARSDAGDILSWANERLAKHQRLSHVAIRGGDFPRNTLGKVLKQQLHAELLEQMKTMQAQP